MRLWKSTPEVTRRADSRREYSFDKLSSKGQRYARELSESVKGVADAEDCEQFGCATLAHLASALPRGHRRQSASRTAIRLEDGAKAVKTALIALLHDVETDPIAAQPFGLLPSGLQRRSDDLLAYLESAIAKASAAEAPRRGPRNLVAVEIATMVAATYEHYLGKRPGRGKRGGENPFHRACSIVEKILTDLGRAVTISDVARAEGLQQARRKFGDKEK